MLTTLLNKRSKSLLALAAATTLMAACGQGQDAGQSETASSGTDSQAQSGEQYSRSQLRIVGSSTVYPFSSYVAEEMGATTDFRTRWSNRPARAAASSCSAAAWPRTPRT